MFELYALLGIAMVLGPPLYRFLVERGEARAFAEAARRLRFSRGSRRGITGSVSGIEAEAYTYAHVDRNGKEGFRRTVVRAHGAPENVTLRAQGVLDLLRQVPVGGDIPTGDPWFDEGVAVFGLPARVRIVLDAPARQVVFRFVHTHGGVVRDGVAEIDQVGVWDADGIVNGVQAACEVVRALQVSARDAAERLLRTATTDPVPGVRRLALADLQELEPGMADEAAGVLLDDPDPGVRAWAAARARSVPVLRTLLDVPLDEESLLRILDALPADPAFEGPLLRLLASSASVRVATVHALGTLASLDAVSPLTELTSGVLVSREVKEAAAHAVAAIRARAQPGAAGRVTIATEGGAVTVAEGGPGRLSEPENGR